MQLAGLRHRDQAWQLRVGLTEGQDLLHMMKVGLCRVYLDSEGKHLANKDGEEFKALRTAGVCGPTAV